MDNKTYKVQEIFKWYKKYDKSDLLIKSANKEFNIEINSKSLPHLLGLQYINSTKKDMNQLKGRRLYNYIEHNNLSDQEIYNLVSLNNEDKLNDVSNRINTFKEFMENLDKGYILEQTNPHTQIKSQYLVVQSKENLFLHLGIKEEIDGEKIVDFKVDDKTRDILETYFARGDIKYFENSKIFEKIEKIERYDEIEKDYIQFSFDEEKNKNLLIGTFTKTELESLKKYKSEEFNAKNLEELGNKDFTVEQMKEIIQGFEYYLSTEQVKTYANNRFTAEQMDDIKMAYAYGLDSKIVEKYARPDLTHKQLTAIYSTYIDDKYPYNEKSNKEIVNKIKETQNLEVKELKNLVKETIKKEIPKDNYNVLTGNPIIAENHSSGDKRWIAMADIKDNNISVKDNENPTLTIVLYDKNGKLHASPIEYYNVSQLEISKELEQKFVPMKEKDKNVEKSKDRGIER